MKKLALLLLTLTLCTACAALPAEERAFAVALCVEREGEIWRVHGRIPTYQNSGGYLTVTGEGRTLEAALSDMDSAAPMPVHLSQLRLLVLHKTLGESGDAAMVLHTLADRADMRLQCAVAVTEAPSKAVADALEPATGARLSKALDVLMESRIGQGSILSAALGDVVRMGERQTPVLMALTMEDGAVDLSGGYPLTFQGRIAERLTETETGLLALLRGEAKTLRITLPGGTAQVRDANAGIRLSQPAARVELQLQSVTSDFTAEGLAQALAEALAELLARLSASGCDVLGLGRKAILQARDMAAWHDQDWPSRCMELRWEIAVGVTGPA